MNSLSFRSILLLILVYIFQTFSQDVSPFTEQLSVEFAGKYGQLEIGGNFVGAEFHHSLPLPSRISFYYPVANSIDLSTDYWQRDQSHPFSVTLNFDGEVREIGKEPFRYRYTPYYAQFERTYPSYEVSLAYRFCEDFPAMLLQIKIKNLTAEEKAVDLTMQLQTSLRTCHTYAVKERAEVGYLQSGAIAIANFDDVDTDSAQVFVINVGEPPVDGSSDRSEFKLKDVINPKFDFRYKRMLAVQEELVIAQLIGSCRQTESRRMVDSLQKNWQASIRKNEERIERYVRVRGRMELADSAFLQTANWSKAMLAANQHYLNKQIVPMPCPAEYNFYFTHDVLLTDLGAVVFDSQRVKNDLLYLRSLTQSDSVLPHAYYWKDGKYQTEFCGSDNWNHLWFIILVGSYLKHSNDIETATILQPIIRKSISMILLNKGDDNLMYASRPDWWDIGHVYGARAYITALTIRALRMYVYLNLKLGLTDHDLNPYLALVRKMQTQLGERLWDAEAGFLLNMLDSTKVDRHYYAGSLIAAVFDLLEEEKQRTLLETAERKLLDSQIGTRIVMPADFHRLINVYKFKGMEAGEPYVYINGGVWPQGIVWYALGWLSLGRPDKARAIIEKYYTLQGIQNSPNGQPSFFEYRNANAESPHYGEIDKPTFLWAAGWYLHTLYHLAGLRENEWNIAVASHLPSAWQQVNYDILIGGKPVRVSYSGTGKYFKRIEIDGKSSSSAVIDSGSDQIILERGHPETPYLVKANCQIKGVQFSKSNRILRIEARGMLGQPVNLQVISPLKPQGLFVNNRTTHNHFQTHQNDNVWIVIIESSLQELEEIFEIAF